MAGLFRKQISVGSHGWKVGLMGEGSSMFLILKKRERVGGMHVGIF